MNTIEKLISQSKSVIKTGAPGSITIDNINGLLADFAKKIGENINYGYSISDIDTGGIGSEDTFVASSNYNPQHYFYNGVSYFAWVSGATNGGTAYDCFVTSYNHDTGEITTTKIRDTFEGDNHERPSIMVADDGHIIVVVEKNHNSSSEHYRSQNPEDVSVMTLVATLSTYGNAYPCMQKMSDGTILLACRSINSPAYPGQQYNMCVLYKSTDNGLTFTNQTLLTDLGGPNDPWCYVGVGAAHPTGEWAYVFINSLDQDISIEYPRCYVLFSHVSTGFTVWGNIEYYQTNRTGGFSKDISALNTVINRTELDTNCLVSDVGVNQTVYIRDAHFTPNGKFILIYDKASRTNNTDITQYLVTYTNSAWVETQVTGVYTETFKMAATDYDTFITAFRCVDEMQYHMYTSQNDGFKTEVKRHVTYDGGQTWLFDGLIGSGVVNHFRAIVPPNYHDLDYVPIAWMYDDGDHVDIKIARIGKGFLGLMLPEQSPESLISDVDKSLIKDISTSGVFLLGTTQINSGVIKMPVGNVTQQRFRFKNRQVFGTWNFEYTLVDGFQSNSLYICICVPDGDADIDGSVPDDCYLIRIPTIETGEFLFAKSVGNVITNLHSVNPFNGGILVAGKNNVTIVREDDGAFTITVNGNVIVNGMIDNAHVTGAWMSITSNSAGKIDISKFEVY